MTSAAFKNILAKPVDEIKAPTPMPVGSYLGRINKYEFGESNEKKTPFVRFFLVPYLAKEDVDQELLAQAGGLVEKELKITFYITEDSAFRLREFLENDVGITGSSLEAMIPMAINNPVGFYVSQTINKDTGKAFSEIKKTFKAE